MSFVVPSLPVSGSYFTERLGSYYDSTPGPSIFIYFTIFLAAAFIGSVAASLLNVDCGDGDLVKEESNRIVQSFTMGLMFGLALFGIIVWNTSMGNVIISMLIISFLSVVIDGSLTERYGKKFLTRLNFGLLGFVVSVFLTSVFGVLINMSGEAGSQKRKSGSVYYSAIMAIIILILCVSFAVYQLYLINKSSCQKVKDFNYVFIGAGVGALLLGIAGGYGLNTYKDVK